MMVIRKGRKRQDAPRHPGGQLRDEPKESPIIIAMAMPHRQGVPEKDRLDQRAECSLGVLAINAVITAAQYRAGRRYARIVARYVASINAPSPSPPSLAGIMEPRSGIGGHLPDDIARQRKDEYNEAFEYLGSAGQRAQRIVARVAVNDMPCPLDERDNLKRGLSTLDEHFTLTDKAKSDYRNRN